LLSLTPSKPGSGTATNARSLLIRVYVYRGTLASMMVFLTGLQLDYYDAARAKDELAEVLANIKPMEVD